MCYEQIEIKGMWITLIPVYAPTYDKDKEAKLDAFYVELQGVVRRQCS